MESYDNFVSIIIPYFKTSLVLLERLLSSIPEDIDAQIIIVDDNSDYGEQNYLELVDLAHKYRATLLRLEENQGCGGARNEGLKVANGEWLLFADSDDYYDKDNLRDLCIELQKTDRDVVWFGRRIVSNEPIDDYYGLESDGHMHNYDSYCKNLCKSMGPWNKAIRTSFFRTNNLNFEKIPLNEEVLLSVKLFCLSKKTAFYARIVYNYVLTDNSLSKVTDINKILIGTKAYIRAYHYLYSHGLFDKNYLNNDLQRKMSVIYNLSTKDYYLMLLSIAKNIDMRYANYIHKSVNSLCGRISLLDSMRVSFGAFRYKLKKRIHND